ncbi:class I SAM-dependent methyltransferase [Dongia sedimenti]|uniref:Class I SAM-dependent methyltransferase n=1 Tax=Dongia sedimenti TaxID=3064282 RepID=A0ABU0YGI9_9PROT|nr:class I SAM-dependent methyltransferase [Rhodospirillaceae bacterium R-7]
MDSARYVTDVPYARRYVRELSPAWLDFTALICGFQPPPRGSGFAWCELGCGHGVTPALLAAAHPEGRFIGIDLMPQHVEFAERLCREAEITNASFQAVDFAATQALDLPRFDYVVAHGVYTWVDASAQAELLRFAGRHLKPGGLLYLSYDCLPGWAGDMPLQHLLRVLTERAQGDSIARLDSADKIVTALQGLGADVLRLGAMGREWEELRGKLPPSYFVHQFLPPAWKPLYVTELRQAVSGIGLTPIGSATIRENVDAFTLDRPARELVAAASDPDLRELLRDYLLQKRFRRDVFGRDVPALDEATVRARICGSTFMLSHPQDATVPFNHPSAQALLALLEGGAAAPIALADQGHSIDALVAQIIALASAGRTWPVAADPDREGIERVNAVLRRRTGTPDEIAFTMLPSGMAIDREDR